jgi:D-sedoheptulose 7-phosphate isomerase
LSVKDQITESIEVFRLVIGKNVGQIEEMAGIVLESQRKGGKLILLGNGGSQSQAQHIAAEFLGKYGLDRPPMRALALTNLSAITAIGNDYGFEHVYERQIQAQCNVNDVVVGLSTSGKSKDILLAIEAAKAKGAKTVGLTGERGTELASIVDLAIVVPSKNVPRIQEAHLLIGHIVSDIVEREMWPGSR